MDSEFIIALVAILGGLSIPIFWFYFDHKSKERRARVMEKALEVGKSPEEVMLALKDPGAPRRQVRMPYRKGLVLIAIGAALLCASSMVHGDGGLVVVGMILSFLGVAFLLSDFFNRGYYRDQ